MVFYESVSLFSVGRVIIFCPQQTTKKEGRNSENILIWDLVEKPQFQ